MTTVGGAICSDPKWSPDRQWIYFSAGTDEQSPGGIGKISLARGGAVQLTMDGGLAAEESPDMRSLYVVRPHEAGLRLWRVPLDGGQPALVADDVAGAENFVVGRRAVYYVAVGPQDASHPPAPLPSLGQGPGVMHFSVAAIDIATGRRTTLAPAGIVWPGVALSPDERTLIATMRNAETLDLMLVEPEP